MKATYQFFRGEVRAALPLFALIGVLFAFLGTVASLAEVRFGPRIFFSLALVALAAHAASHPPVAVHSAALAARRWHRGVARILTFVLGLGLAAGFSAVLARAVSGAQSPRLEIGVGALACATLVTASVGYTMRVPVAGAISGLAAWYGCVAWGGQSAPESSALIRFEVQLLLLIWTCCVLWLASQERSLRMRRRSRAVRVFVLVFCVTAALPILVTLRQSSDWRNADVRPRRNSLGVGMSRKHAALSLIGARGSTRWHLTLDRVGQVTERNPALDGVDVVLARAGVLRLSDLPARVAHRADQRSWICTGPDRQLVEFHSNRRDRRFSTAVDRDGVVLVQDLCSDRYGPLGLIAGIDAGPGPATCCSDQRFAAFS